MTLEALVDGYTGDVIVVKPLGSIWGRREVNRVFKIDDPDLERELHQSGTGQVIYPYAVYEQMSTAIDGIETKTARKLLSRSLVKISVTDATGMEAPSQEKGILKASAAKVGDIAEVIAAPRATGGGVVLLPHRALPAPTARARNPSKKRR